MSRNSQGYVYYCKRHSASVRSAIRVPFQSIRNRNDDCSSPNANTKTMRSNAVKYQTGLHSRIAGDRTCYGARNCTSHFGFCAAYLVNAKSANFVRKITRIKVQGSATCTSTSLLNAEIGTKRHFQS